MDRRSFFAASFGLIGIGAVAKAPPVSPLVVPFGAEVSVGEVAVAFPPGTKFTGACVGEQVRGAMLEMLKDL